MFIGWVMAGAEHHQGVCGCSTSRVGRGVGAAEFEMAAAGPDGQIGRAHV